jgi:hypothetical protein
MKPLYRGLILAALQLALVLSLGGKFLYDRATRPRVWARTANFDPDLPIRGRYVSLRVEVAPEGFSANDPKYGNQYVYRVPVRLAAKDDKLTAIAISEEDTSASVYVTPTAQYIQGRMTNSHAFYIDEPVAFFIPEHAPNPAALKPGEELWVEVTVPKKGPPRPIRLGLKKDGVLTPLHLE